MHAKEFIAKKDVSKFQQILNPIMSGKSHQEIIHFKSKTGQDLKLIAFFTPVMINEVFEKILFLAININDY